MKKLFVALLLSLLPVVALAQTAKSPNLKLKNLSGRPFSLSDYKGKVVLINFWATWCPPCRAEIPELRKLQRDYGSRGLQVIGITYPPQKVATVRRFVRQAKVNYPVALGTKETKLLFTQSDTLPMTVVIGKDGSILDVIEGILLPDEFEQKIKPLLQ
jgi:thiol-disulfide isomerase/thioredoxin